MELWPRCRAGDEGASPVLVYRSGFGWTYYRMLQGWCSLWLVGKMRRHTVARCGCVELEPHLGGGQKHKSGRMEGKWSGERCPGEMPTSAALFSAAKTGLGRARVGDAMAGWKIGKKIGMMGKKDF